MVLDLLAGLRVVECSAFVAAPLCGNTLGYFGADVIRIDPLQGGLDYRRWPVNAMGGSIYWAGLNNAKRSVAIDLRSQEGKDLARAIVTAPGPDAGIFSTNLAPAWASYADLCALRPDLIMLSIEGHPDGRSAVDYTANVETGLPYITGTGSTDAPVSHSLPAWDLTTGLYGALALVSAEGRRRRSGRGAHIRLALSDVAFAMMATLGYTGEVEINGSGREAVGNYVYGTFGRDFITRDGGRIMIVAVTSRQWQSLCRATGLEAVMAEEGAKASLDFAREGDRFLGRETIATHLSLWCGARGLPEINAVFEGTGVCWGAYRSVTEAVRNDPRFAGSSDLVFQKVDHAGVGRMTSAGPAIRIEDEARDPIPSVPLLGEHTREVLSELLSLPDPEIDRLRDRGIIAEAR